MPNETTFTFKVPTTFTTVSTTFPYSPSTIAAPAIDEFDSFDVTPNDEEPNEVLQKGYENSTMLDELINGKDKPVKKTASDIYSEQIQQMLEKLGIKSINFKTDDFVFPRDSRQSHKVFSKLADILYEWKHNDLQIEDEV